jgi:CTP synthase (UTP-ammonia lyase)
MAEAEFEETDPNGPALIITRLAYSLLGLQQEVVLVPGTLAAEAYGVERATEQFLCRFGVNEAYREQLFSGDLRVAATDMEGNVRLAELVSHPFFMGTLFVPQCSSQVGEPHPLIVAFVEAAAAFGAAGNRKQAATQGGDTT